MKPEDINFTDGNNEEDEMMTLIEHNIALKETVDTQNELIKNLDDQAKNLEDICHLHEMKELALKMYIKALEDELNDEDDSEEE